MKNWHEYRNFKKSEKEDGSFNFYIIIEGTEVEVSEEIYTVYAQGAYKMGYMENDLKRDRVKKDADSKAVRDDGNQVVYRSELEMSLDKLFDDDWDFPSSELSPEEAFFYESDFESKELNRCLSLLTKSERALINALFYEGMTEKDYADKTGVTQPGVNQRKNRILKKLKSIFWKTL